LFWKLDSIPRANIDRNALEQVPVSGSFTNIALFGLDAREDDPGMGERSDSIMVASINNRTGEVKVLSILRDTLMMQQDGTYEKANAAYSFGGPQQAVAMLNRNLDLDIERFVTVDFHSLSKIIDILGGVEIDIQADEIDQVNQFALDVATHTGEAAPPVITAPGPQMLTGAQATGYSRVRYTAGDDFRRAERQRNVIQQIINRTRTAGPLRLIRIVDTVLPLTVTNLSTPDMLGIGRHLLGMRLNEMGAYPFDVTTSANVSGLVGDYVVPIGTADNVRQLHGFLFGDDTYQVSDRVQQISADIAYMTGIYP